MYFEQGHLYHIYNQGNNRQSIFFGRENYIFFLEKIRMHMLPFGDILAYCLMPNHFHIMMKVNSVELDAKVFTQYATTHQVTQSHLMSSGSKRTLNMSVAIMLRSYTRAINKQNDWSGSLFRQKTKAECLTQIKGITPSFYNTNQGTKIHLPRLETEYPQNCFNYIHQNPVKAGIVNRPGEWEFSSYLDYFGNRKETLINKIAARDSGIIY